MEQIGWELFSFLVMLAFVCEFIDASIGMGYGTILSPVLLILGFSPMVAIPAILITQAIGGLMAAIFHHRFHNVDFKRDSQDLAAVYIISGLGIIATILAVIVAVNIPKQYVKGYIGILVIIMGIIVLINRPFRFTKWKLTLIGFLSAFNKGMSGGGFGPVVTGGQILAGYDQKAAVGVTTLSEVPICICGSITYFVMKKMIGMPEIYSQWQLLVALTLGVIIVAPIAAQVTRLLKKEKIHLILGIVMLVLGSWTLIKVFY